MRVERTSGDAHREFATLSIDDGAASAADLDDLLVLPPGLCPQGIGLEDLQLAQPNGDRDCGDGDRGPSDEYAASDQALIHDGRDPLHACMI
jgi:hypothetical protein